MKRIVKRTILFVVVALLVLMVVGVVGAHRFFTHRVEGEYFDSDGVRIHYTDEGEGEPVVLIHGFAVNADLNWRRNGITQALSEEFRVIAMDTRGHGLSGKPHDADQYGIEMVEDVVRLLDHLEIEKAHVAGYSLGGFLSLKLAAEHPERLLSASPLAAGWEPGENNEFLSAMDQIIASLEAGDGIAPLSGNLGEGREKPGLRHTLMVKFLTKYFNDPHALIGVIRGLPEILLTEEEVRGISVPVCSIVGTRDPLKPGVDAMKGLVADHTVVLIDGADHIEAPWRPEFLEAMLGFLRAHRSGSSEAPAS